MVGNTTLCRTKMGEVRYGNLTLMRTIKRFQTVVGPWAVALESAHVCLINATGTGIEILKSLVLPGVGAFTIVDGKKVTEENTGCKLVFCSKLRLDFP